MKDFEAPQKVANTATKPSEEKVTKAKENILNPLPFMSEPAPLPPRKRLFIGLITGSSILLCLLLLVGWIIPFVGFGNIHPSVPYITGALLVASIASIAWAAFGLVVQILTGKPLWGSDRVRGMTIKVFLPLMELLAKGLGISSNRVRQSFIKVNNELALAHLGKIAPEKLLILLPHCVQRADCTARLSFTTKSCTRCGRCPMAQLLDLQEKYGVHLAVATGGSIARRIVVETRPKLIIAVACERDLASGIQDTHPLPVFGILNHRPEGPCKNTTVSLPLLEQALKSFLNVLPPEKPAMSQD